MSGDDHEAHFGAHNKAIAYQAQRKLVFIHLTLSEGIHHLCSICKSRCEEILKESTTAQHKTGCIYQEDIVWRQVWHRLKA